MAKSTAKRKPARSSSRTRAPAAGTRPTWRRIRRWIARGALGVVVLFVATVLLYRFVPPPTTLTILGEARRLGGVERTWVPLERISGDMARAAIAAEDANFCRHWGFDMAAIRTAIAEGADRGASTISQQTVKNVFLWQSRTWPRKALEGLMTPIVEAFWSKRRILEVYLNVAEFGEGVFGVEAAARQAFGVRALNLTADQAARLAAVLPNPKDRSAADPSDFVRRRARSIRDGAATIRADGRADCI